MVNSFVTIAEFKKICADVWRQCETKAFNYKENQMKIEVGKWYKNKQGDKVYIAAEYNDFGQPRLLGYYKRGDGDIPCTWFIEGLCYEEAPSDLNIVEEWKEPKLGELYVKVFTDSYGKVAYSTSDNNLADLASAVIKVKWVEGQFDE